MSTALPAHAVAPLLAWVLRVCGVLAPPFTAAQLLPTAEAIVAVTDTREEAALLAVVDWHETRFGLDGLRWGLVTRRVRARLRGRPLDEHAETARDALRVGARLCGARWVLHWYHTGECPCLRLRCPRELRPTRFSEREYRRWRKVLRTG
jgi:hypothetical protein